jgi:hypothetical protein
MMMKSNGAPKFLATVQAGAGRLGLDQTLCQILFPQKFIIVSKCFQCKDWSSKKGPVGVRKRCTLTMLEFVCVYHILV